jgi:hypothetical protein
MQNLRRTRHYGPITYAAWAAIYIVIGTLASVSLWPH